MRYNYLSCLAFVLFIFSPAVRGLVAETPIYDVGNRTHASHAPDYYLDHIQPILSSRCVACNGCYEAPCQLNFESYEGLRRGYNPEPIYASSRIREVKPTRMIDARSVPEWREKGFFPVVSSSGDEPENATDDPKASLMYELLDQSAKNNAPGFDFLKLLDLQKSINDTSVYQCMATPSQWTGHFQDPANNPWKVKPYEQFISENPLAGMPFGLPQLSSEDHHALAQWIEDGAKGPSKSAEVDLESPARPEIVAAWEDFLNGDSLKAQHSARYIYEHVFTAHAYFEEMPGEYYMLVRSKTRSGEIDQIVTELPYDDPGVSRPYYRFKKITQSIAQKTHFVWRLNQARLAHLRSLFLDSDWSPTEPPVYGGDPNPFVYFAVIPAKVRDTFLIENARIIVGGMTQGSVCVGSTATYAISDHFWAWFLKPDSDPSVVNPNLGLTDVNVLATAPLEWHPSNPLERWLSHRLDRLTGPDPDLVVQILSHVTATLGITPSPEDADSVSSMITILKEYGLKGDEILGAIHHFMRTINANYTYQKAWERSLREMLKGEGRDSLAINDLWHGEGDPTYPGGNNPNAWLSITRHGKSATVQFGSEGGIPQSIWVMSYSNFERLYYNLVASFKEWGSVTHKMATWRHMSYVRLEGEDLAISFLPIESRKEVRARFARGLAGVLNAVHFPLWSTVGLNSDDHDTYSSWLRHPGYSLNPFASYDYPPRPSPYSWRDADGSIQYLVAIMRQYEQAVDRKPEPVSADRMAFEAELDKLSEKSLIKDGVSWPQFMPDIAYLRVEGDNGETWVYSFIADRGYKAHNVMLAESLNRDPQYDTLSWYRGFVGAYPNVMYDVPKEKRARFLYEFRELFDQASFQRFEAKWGVARNSNRFWSLYDWFHAYKASSHPGVDPVDQGIVDLSQYDFFDPSK